MLLLCGRIDYILHKAAERRKVTAGDGIGSMLPWTDVISACVDYQLACLRYQKVGCCCVLLVTYSLYLLFCFSFPHNLLMIMGLT